MKTMNCWINKFTMATTVCAATLAANGQFPKDSMPPLEEAQRLAAKQDWSGAMGAYTEHLKKLSTRNYRDKKTYEWILVEFEKANPGDLTPLNTVAVANLAAIGDADAFIARWRLHQLIARIAEKQDNATEQRAQLMKAIEFYPDVDYAEPSKHSKLQHLYNEVALLRAEENLEEAEDWLIEAFEKDERFDYVFVPAWNQFYKEHDQLERYQVFLDRLIVVVEKKATIRSLERDR